MVKTQKMLESYLKGNKKIEEMISADIPQDHVPEIPYKGGKTFRKPYDNSDPFGPANSQDHLLDTINKFLELHKVN